MSGPKHLWSGDWESESRQPAVTQLPVRDEPEAQPAPPPQRRTGFSRRQLAIALSAGLAAAIVTVALALTLSGSNKPRAHAKHTATASRPSHGTPGQPQKSGGGGLSKPGQSCQQKPASCVATTTTPVVQTGPSADWMGLQIVTSPSGVVVSTVKLGSAGDLAGFEPGDQIDKVEGHVVGTVSELRADTNGVQVGSPVTVEVMRGSVPLSLASPHMTQRPIIHP